MKRTFLSLCMVAVLGISAHAQSFVESFDANSLGWTESAGESNSGTAIIDKGVLTIKSKGDSKFMRFAANFNGNAKGSENTAFETHCYAPINVNKPFEIIANVKMDNLDLERQAGLIFNYRDFGNFYAFVFNRESVSFLRFVDNRCVGSITQDIKWGKAEKGKQNQVWKLISDGDVLSFFVNGLEIMKVRYMPLDFTGVGFYTFGKQTLVVDEVTFTQSITDNGMAVSGWSSASANLNVGATGNIVTQSSTTNEKDDYILVYKRKKKSEQQWRTVERQEIHCSYSHAEKLAEKWNNKKSDTLDYKCTILISQE